MSIRNVAWWFALAVIACLVYCTIARDLLVSDDFSLVHAVRDGGPFAVWSGPRSEAPWFFRPLISLSFYIDYRVWGIRAFGYHLTNLMFHATNAFLVGRIALALLRDRAAAIAATLIFVVLPVHAESVTWISGRTDVIATTFGLAAFAAYLHYVESGKRSSLVFALLLLAVGLAAKEILIALPLVMLGHALLVAGEGKRRGLSLGAASCILVIAYIGVRRLAVGAWIGGYGTATHLNHDPRFLTRNVSAYLVHMVGFGVPPHGDGAWPAIIHVSTIVLALAFLAVIACCLVDRARHRAFPGHTLLFLLAASFVTILPSINLAVDANGSEGERYLYLSSAWFAILIAALLRPAIAWPFRVVTFAALLLGCMTALVARNADWHRASRLCRNVLTDLSAAPRRDGLYVLDMPDNIHDAYVFRNSIWDALALLYPHADTPPIYVIGYRRLLAATHPQGHIVRNGDEISLTLDGDGDRLEYWSLLAPATDAYTLARHEPLTLTVHVRRHDNIAYYVFANDHLQRIDDQPR